MTDPAAEPAPLVAQVALDVALPHLDRPFDYLVPDAQRDAIAVGCRVRARFSGKLTDGFVVALSDTSEVAKLRPLERVVSPEVVLTPAVVALCRAVADHYGGTFSDVVRMAVPARHAATEAAEPPAHPAPLAALAASVLPLFPGGAAYLAALTAGSPLRAAWTPAPVHGPAGDWASGFAEAAAATVAGGRGVLLIVPDADALARLAARCTDALGAGAFVTLSAELGPAARYRAFLAVARGQVQVVLGTRNAGFAPVPDLGLIGLWDEGNDALAEPRAPYPHAREVAALRASLERCALLVAGHARTAETQALVERGWLGALTLTAAEARRLSPVVRIAADTDLALERDPAARAARLPHDAFAAIRRGLAAGPVLLQVPRAGYVASVACAGCRAPARCPRCRRALRGDKGAAELRLVCGLCGPVPGRWRCPECGDTRLRAPQVGVKRTAEEIGRAFPQVRVVESWSGHPVAEVPDEPALVLSTPGAEPAAVGGYAAAILLDTQLLLTRPELRASEEALRRWLAVCALVRPAADGGTVLAVGETDARALQALVRLDPVGFAARELAERRATGFPPAAKLAFVEGPPAAVNAYAAAVAVVPDAELFGPLPLGDDVVRLTVRCPLTRAGALLAALTRESAERSARKEGGGVRVRVDPQVID